MTITIFVSPSSFQIFLEVTCILSGLEIENDYVFQPTDLQFTESMVSNYVWVNIDVEEYLKLKYCMEKLSVK